MTHEQIYNIFLNNFPQFIIGTIEAWFPNGRHCIRLHMKNKDKYVFTYEGANEWSFETVDSYIKRLRGRTKI